MEDELNLEDLDTIEANTENRLKVKDRFGKLSEKLTLTSKEKDEALAKAQTEADARVSAEKERDFFKDFSANVSKYPHATEYQDQILEKVKGGYTTEDAMVAVLNREGKLVPQSPEAPRPEGGSAPTVMTGDKSIGDMSSEEKLAALTEIDKTGDLASALRGR